ncbi:MAG TPA: DUF502 domain-containing protein [Planctomycetota bacterium]|nr:DUF502 domain-containing protein [Planctomycetota bacterium]
MRRIVRHCSRTLIAGVVAVLPIAGLALTVVWLEREISASWLARQEFYFPGAGLILVALALYLIGLVASTLAGRWTWGLVDRAVARVPALGRLYRTFKQILGYGDGPDALFRRVVLVPSDVPGAVEFGLVTSQFRADDGRVRLVVFAPGAPNPTSGKLLMVDESQVTATALPVSDALKALVSAGATIDAPPR